MVQHVIQADILLNACTLLAPTKLRKEWHNLQKYLGSIINVKPLYKVYI